MSLTKTQKHTLAKIDWYRQQDKDNVGEDGSAENDRKDLAVGNTDRVLEAITCCCTSLTSQIEEVKV